MWVLAVGAALRFYGFPSIPFTYDELSAWGRTDYASFNDLIRFGVRGDGHPALVQVFLFYWRKIFGDSEAAFKFPFLLAGVGVVFLTYRLGKMWFSETAGLLAAACLATLQYPVMYSQIARPYLSGLLFSLLMVISWSRFVFAEDGSRKKSALIWFVAWAVLCAYNHYFSALFALLVGSSGYFFLPRKEWREYTSAGGIGLVFFLPHWGITMQQFTLGGVGGWLAPPNRWFFTNYLDYVFQFSWWVKGWIILLAAAGFYFIAERWREKNKLRLLAFAWFMLPIAIGFFYSRLRNPVLQYSVLLFSFPFLLFLLFSFYREMKTTWLAGLVLVTMLVISASLVLERKHFEIFYKQPVEQLAESTMEFAQKHPGARLTVVIQEPAKYMNYYFSRRDFSVPVHSFAEAAFSDYRSAQQLLVNENADYVICGNLPYPNIKLFMVQYPKVIEVKKGFTYDWMVLAKEAAPQPEIKETVFYSAFNPLSPDSNWKMPATAVAYDSGNVVRVDPSMEFSPGFFAPLNRLMKNRDDFLVVAAYAKNVQPQNKAYIVISVSENDSIFFYQAKPVNIFVDAGRGEGWLVNAIRFRDFTFPRSNSEIRFYCWNPEGDSFDLAAMEVTVMKGNPLIYSMLEQFPRKIAGYVDGEIVFSSPQNDVP
jgi:hypothetical protein